MNDENPGYRANFVLAWILIVLVVVGIGIALVFTAAFDQEAFIPAATITVLLTGYWVYLSVWKLDKNVATESYLFGTHVATLMTEGLKAEYVPNNRPLSRVRSGFAKTDWGVFIRPLWQAVRFPISAISVFLRTSRIYTKATYKSETNEEVFRVVMEADPLFKIRFRTLRYLLEVIDIPTSEDLTQKVKLGDETNQYEDFLLGKYIFDEIDVLFMEAVRKACNRFAWDDPKQDLVDRKREVELAILYELSERGSILEESKILRRPTKIVEEREIELTWEECCALPQPTQPAFYGDSVISIDINLAKIQFASVDDKTPEAAKAVQRPYIGRQTGREKAEETVRVGKARAGAVEAMNKVVGDTSLAAASEVLKGSPVTLNQIGGDVKELLTGVLGKVQGSPKPSNEPITKE